MTTKTSNLFSSQRRLPLKDVKTIEARALKTPDKILTPGSHKQQDTLANTLDSETNNLNEAKGHYFAVGTHPTSMLCYPGT